MQNELNNQDINPENIPDNDRINNAANNHQAEADPRNPVYQQDIDENIYQPLIEPLDMNRDLQPAPGLGQTSLQTDKVEIQRLKGPNWASWKWQIRNLLDSRGLTDVLTGNETRGSPREVATRQIISSALDQSLVSKVIHCESAQQIWSCLQGIYENKTSFALTDLIGRMNSFKMHNLEDVENGVSEIQAMACQIKALGGKIDDATIESAILRALPKSFASFITSWTFLDLDKRNLENLHAHIMRNVSVLRLDENDVKDKALAAKHRSDQKNQRQSGKTNSSSNNTDESSNKSSNSKPNLFCRYCKLRNHDIKNCRVLARKNNDKDLKPAAESGPNKPNKDFQIEKSSGASNHDESKSSARVAYGHLAKVSKPQSDYVKGIWIADSGASFHMTSHLEWLSDYQEFTNRIQVKLGDSFIVQAHGKGFIETTVGIIEPVYYLPDIADNLFSISSCARTQKIYALSTEDSMIFLQGKHELFRARLNDFGVYELVFDIKPAQHTALLSTTLEDWHDRLAHIPVNMIKYMADHNIVNGIRISNKLEQKCEPCASGKIQRVPHCSKTTPRAALPGQILHFDTVGPMPEPSLGGALYYVLCKDSCSGYRKIFFVASKADIAQHVKQVISESRIETGNEVLQICTDQGSEYLNNNLKTYLADRGIVHITSAVYTPEQNGLIERDIRTVAQAARTLRIKANLPKKFWAESMSTSVYLLNRVINSRDRHHTAYEIWFKRKPSLNNIHKFGELAIVRVQSHKRDKLDPQGKRMIFVGYTNNHNTFRFIDPDTDQLTITSDAIFLNKLSNIDASNGQNDQPSSFSFCPSSVDTNEPAPLSSTPLPQPTHLSSFNHTDESDEHIESGQNRTFDAQVPSHSRNETFDISDIHENDFENRAGNTFDFDMRSPAIMPSEHPDPERMATLRPRHNRPNYAGWKVDLATVDAVDDPQSFNEAMERPDKDMWLQAMREELASLDKLNVYSVVNKPANCNIVSNRWVLRVKGCCSVSGRLQISTKLLV
jgi:hypothetical protein